MVLSILICIQIIHSYIDTNNFQTDLTDPNRYYHYGLEETWV